MNSKKKEKRKHLKDAAREIPDRYWGKKKKKKFIKHWKKLWNLHL